MGAVVTVGAAIGAAVGAAVGPAGRGASHASQNITWWLRRVHVPQCQLSGAAAAAAPIEAALTEMTAAAAPFDSEKVSLQIDLKLSLQIRAEAS